MIFYVSTYTLTIDCTHIFEAYFRRPCVILFLSLGFDIQLLSKSLNTLSYFTQLL